MTLTERDAIKVFFAVGAVLLAGLVVFEPLSLLSVAALPGVAGLIVLVWGVMNGKKYAVLLHLFVAIFLVQAVFRVRDYQDKDIDFQVVLKIGVWITLALAALVHLRSWLRIVLMPTNFPWILFLAWLFVTVIVSPVPSYTAVAAFTVFSCVVFSAFLFSTFEEADIFATIIASITLFCIVSIAVYFAIPEFGHYVYWINNQRFISPRLAGIAGSANNMALIAAFAIVVIGLYAREFHRMHILFAPVSGLFALAALLMTNSRGPLVASLAILFIVYMLNWRRLYAAIFIGSMGLIGLALILPMGEQFLLKMISRSGEEGEVTSFTGRTEIWRGVLKLASAEPWMGYGYASSVFVLPQHASEIGFTTSHAHNVILQLLLTTGWIGVGLFVLTVMSVGLRAALQRDRLVFAMLLFVIFNGITESSGFTTLANICTFAFAIAITLPPLQRSQASYENHPAYQR
jgi:O-antigen ligase